ncbi:MAG: phosphate/phosphite/phosphonate ABC transporter substrate-binding protein [Candidatus Abyssobacteria bacterium SURF_17]|jgi:phosphate transport system substrate-binding protein|uniref:Phosphate/phosphite/phosphonate ABC transporter substrate-binding protein n=1 Tax=Candidatus Abyssobacteria bacterium SURF_17 TaxID=2093361 RepID=A0A419F273_9BACT|nr:MAG: phosphate/phosphite/phosphonate ABC transporter substrate-binding protein [Candidatus Abyssubacteria bacterium SURF_17]
MVQRTLRKASDNRIAILFVLGALSFSFVFSFCSREEPPVQTTLAGNERILISGSAAMTPLLKTLAREFSKKEPGIEMVFPPDSHSDAGIAGAAERKYDIGAISREMSPSEKEADLQYLHLAVDGMIFCTNENVTITNLTTNQIRHIYAGIITNWGQVGGPDAQIALIDRPEHTSAKIAFRATFLGNDFRVDPEAMVIERPYQVAESIQLIPYSIGYTALAEIVMEDLPVNVISVNGVEPTPANIQDGHYKFFRPLGLVLSPAPKASTMKFVNFVFSETGSKIIANSGYVPQRYEILVGIVPEQNLLVQSQRYEPLVEYLSHKLGEGFSVKLKLLPTYIEACRSLANGDINAAFLGSLAYATVRDYVTVLARPDYGGVSTYRGIVFVRADSGIESVEQMRGRRLVMGGKTTTAGYVFPLYYFKDKGISDYGTYFSEASFVGTHEDAILAVLEKRADVGAAKDLVYRMLVRENPALEQTVRILAQSPPVPSNAFVLRKNLTNPCFECHQRRARRTIVEEEISSKMDIALTIKDSLLGMSQDPEGKAALMALGNADRFLETTDSDYSELYGMLDEINLNPSDLLNVD